MSILAGGAVLVARGPLSIRRDRFVDCIRDYLPVALILFTADRNPRNVGLALIAAGAISVTTFLRAAEGGAK